MCIISHEFGHGTKGNVGLDTGLSHFQAFGSLTSILAVMPWIAFTHPVLPGDLLYMLVDLCKHCEGASGGKAYVEPDH